VRPRKVGRVLTAPIPDDDTVAVAVLDHNNDIVAVFGLTPREAFEVAAALDAAASAAVFPEA
jgi:hypothetical protein